MLNDPTGKPRVVFGGRKRNEHVSPFPTARLLHWKPKDEKFNVEKPAFSLVVTSDVLREVNAHVSQDLKNELGGFFLGNSYVCPNSRIKYIQIDNCPAAKFASSGPVSLDLVNRTFQHFLDEKESKYRGKDAVGWYHSHPDKGVFLSTMDVGVHKSRFPAPWTVALVIDPNGHQGGFFCWRDGELHPHAMMEFYELRGIGSPASVTCMPWTNYQCFDSDTHDERAPQLAAGAGLGEVSSGRGRFRLPWWIQEYRPYIGVAALLLVAVFLGWQAGWIGRKSAPVVPEAVSIATPNTHPGPADPPNTEKASPSPAPIRGQSLVQTVGSVPRGKKYEMYATFNKKPEDLQIEIQGRKYEYRWKKDLNAIVDISDTPAAKGLTVPGASVTIDVYLSGANDSGWSDRRSLTLNSIAKPKPNTIIIRTKVPYNPHPAQPTHLESTDVGAGRASATEAQGQHSKERERKMGRKRGPG
jgi:proteasome lid subunit RPN8/RPN11